MKRLGELKRGTIFNYAKEKFVALGVKNGGVHVLRAQSGEDRCAFYEGDEAPYNHYGKSTLREHIEQDFLQGLIRNGANPEDWIPFDLDLCETDGSVGYGILEDVQAAPLTLREWGRYKDVIPNNEDGPFWLATPFWTPRSPYMNDSRHVWNVNSGGGCGSWYDYYTYGVRPGLILKSSLLVSYEGEDEDIDLTKVQNEAFLKEAERRWKEGMFSIRIDDADIAFEEMRK